MTMPSHAADHFGLGFRIGLLADTLVLGALYVVAAPTSHFRARIPFLLHAGGVGAVFVLLLTFAVVGAGAMAIAHRSVTRLGLRGIVVAAVAGTAAVYSGAASWLSPQFPEGPVRWGGFCLLLTVVGAALVRERRRSLHR